VPRSGHEKQFGNFGQNILLMFLGSLPAVEEARNAPSMVRLSPFR
jgi:hypothetical protein